MLKKLSINYIISREKGLGTISFNYHVTFPSTNLEKLAIFQDISMGFHENFYRKIKTIRRHFLQRGKISFNIPC